MTLALNDRVQQTGTANTTVSFTLSGSVVGFQTFAVIGNGNTTYYGATDPSGNWEVGIGTYSTTGPTLTRTTILSSSNSGSAVTFSGDVTVFVSYPAEKSVNLDSAGNVSALGTVSSGTWQGSTVGVTYGGTGVTSSSGANSVVLRDANANVVFNNFTAAANAVTASGGTTVLTVASARTQILVGSTTHTFQLPDATTVGLGQSFVFVNNSSGALTVTNNASATVETVPSGGITQLGALSIATSAGTWGAYSFVPAAVDWGTNALNLASTVISGGTWQGGTIAGGYGGTGLSTFTAANNALYSTGTTTLTAGTLPVAAGGTGNTSVTAGYIPYGAGTSPLTTSSSLQFNGTYLVVGGTTPLSGATNPITAFSSTANNYVQTYVYNANSGTNASSDFVAYTDNSTDAHGWADVGFTSSTYASTDYSITGPNEAYVLGSAPSGSGNTGNLVYATDSTGTQNYHQWYVGGFTQLKPAWRLQLTDTLLQAKGTLQLMGSSSGYVGLKAATAAGSTTYTLPAADGSSGYALTTDGSGTLSWAAAGSNVTTKGLFENANTISSNYSITSGNNAISAGPITVNSGVTVTVPAGSVWTVT